MRTIWIIAATMSALATLSCAAQAEDSTTEKSAPMKGPPNANGDESTAHKTAPMKGSPNASGFDEKKSQSNAPK